MKDYNEMSDFEINKLVAMTIEGVDFDIVGNAKYAVDCFIKSIDGESVNVLWSGDREYSFFNPCNNPSDMWPLILEIGICITVNRFGEWYASALDSVGEFKQWSDKNPLRAAAIVYLMLKDEK